MIRNYELGKQTVFDALKREVASPTQSVMLGGREAAILKLLCMHSNEVVSKEQMLQQVWGKVLVSETSLTKAISNLRKSLARIEHLSCEIKTIPKEGYVLICESGGVLEQSIEMAPEFIIKQIKNGTVSIERIRRMSSKGCSTVELAHSSLPIRSNFMTFLASSLLASLITGALFFFLK